MRFSIEIQDAQFRHATASLLADLAAPEQLLANIGEALFRVNSERHLKQKVPNGSAWKPLAPATLKKKRKSRILYEENDLLGSFHYQVSGYTLTLNFTDHKAIWHHEGTKPYEIRPRLKKALAFNGIVRARVHHPGLPARPLVGFPGADAQLVADVCRDHINAIFKRV